MNEKYFVIAGNSGQYLDFAKRKAQDFWNLGISVSLSHFVYADEFCIRGNRNPSGWFIGTWYERNDAYNILSLLLISTDDPKKRIVLNDQMTYLLTKKQIMRLI
jgi:hypothetical protein